MFYVYIIKSNFDKELYIGSTSNLRKRFFEHNAGKVRSTKGRAPFKLVYYEAYFSEDDARHREQSLKLRGRARRQLLNRIKKSLEK
ncbi:MAG: GIY-YIG nuclease family protein [Candidatus Doudnabacteria bacterium]|nr:GIY-YIG nuclease family protein [Candidatus Doudnabacteria bacterium]